MMSEEVFTLEEITENLEKIAETFGNTLTAIKSIDDRLRVVEAKQWQS